MDRIIKIRYYYCNDAESLWFHRDFTLIEVENAFPYEVLTDNPLLKRYRLAKRVQLTGLTDKNGIEICEGDIRRFKTGIGIIIWSDAAFAVKSPGSEAIDWEHSTILIDSEYHGNIFETPEIINP
jgi:hypothetical protein